MGCRFSDRISVSMQDSTLTSSSSKVVVAPHSKFGLSAYAAVPIAAGELVLSEPPLVQYQIGTDHLVPQLLQLVLQQQQRQQLHRGSKLQLPAWDWQNACAALLAFCRATESTQTQLLEGMHNRPCCPSVERTSPMRRTTHQAAVLASLAPSIIAVLQPGCSTVPSNAAAKTLDSAADIQRVLLSFELNAHELKGSTAVFEVGSKLAHTCSSPNTTYQSCMGRGCHVALQDIAQGQLLTTCYLHADDLVMSTFARKLKLWESFCFSCGCERCSSEVDCLAGIPCQACAPPAFKRDKQGMLPGGEHGSSAAAHSSSSSPVGVLRFHPELATGSANNISSSTTGDEVPHVSKPWQCSKCGVWLPDEDAALFGPQLAGPDPCGESSRIESYLWHYVKWVCDENPRGVEMGQLMQLMHDVQQFVGPYHWATHYVLRVRAECLRGLLLEAASDARTHLPVHQALQEVQEMAEGINSYLQQTWLWLTEQAECSTDAAAHIVCQALVFNGCSLIEAAAQLLLRVPPRHMNAARRIQHMGAALLSKAEPQLAKLRRWPLPEPHPWIDSISEALEAVAVADELLAKKGIQAEPADDSGVGSRDQQMTASTADEHVKGSRDAAAAQKPTQLSMNELMEFLPPAAAMSAGSSRACGSCSSSSSRRKSSTGKGKKQKQGGPAGKMH